MEENGLPSGWVSSSVGELFRLIGGGTPSTEVDRYWGGDIPWITSADIDEFGRITPRRHITREAVDSSAANVVPAGSIIVVTRVGLGKVALTGGEMAFSQDCHALVLRGEVVFSRFAEYYLRWTARNFRFASRGTTISGITKKTLAGAQFPLPPLPEQRRIVAAIEEHFTKLDAAVAALERVRANLRRYRASVLQAAGSGRLVPTEAELARAEGRDYEPADELLQRILKERRARWEAAELEKMQARGKSPKDERWKARYQEPAPPDSSELPELPEGWVWGSVEQLSAGDLSNGRSVTTGTGPPVLRLTAMKGGQLDFSEAKQGSWTYEEAKPYFVRSGDFFVMRGSGSLSLVGRGALAATVPFEVAYPDTMIRVPLAPEGVNPRFVQMIWDSSLVRRQVEGTARTTAGIYKINQQDIRAIVIPLPLAAEQERIVAEVDRRLSGVEKLEAEVEHALARAGRLRQAILRRAFAGRFVPQDPRDEPASALVERIRGRG